MKKTKKMIDGQVETVAPEYLEHDQTDTCPACKGITNMKIRMLEMLDKSNLSISDRMQVAIGILAAAFVLGIKPEYTGEMLGDVGMQVINEIREMFKATGQFETADRSVKEMRKNTIGGLQRDASFENFDFGRVFGKHTLN